MGAAVALIHDVLFTLAAIALANMEFDLTTVAALLTVVGFSVNDTVDHLGPHPREHAQASWHGPRGDR